MNSAEKQKRVYIRNALLSFICTAICIFIDIRNFVSAGHIFFNWKLGVSYLLYIALIFMGIRAVIMARRLGKEEKQD